MAEKSITLRIQSREGTKRIQILPSTSMMALFSKVKESFGYTSSAFRLHQDRSKKIPVNPSKLKTINSMGLKHGDMLYLTPEDGISLLPNNVDEVEPMDATPSGANEVDSGEKLPDLQRKISDITEDAVDIELNGKDGMIPRKKDPRYCKHGANAGCVHCCPLPPYDEGYLKENKIKHMSFHSYLRKLTSGIDKGKFVSLDDLSLRIKEGCSAHPPWPKGICSKCQPSAVTLTQQEYRHVDSVMFENADIVDQFLTYWRVSGFQRVGLLYGSYEEYEDAPLGIRARVAAIYELPQENDRDNVNFVWNDPKLPVVNEIATGLGLRCVGWIFTDLIPEDQGTVKHLRGGHSFFLSAQECVTAAYFQSLHPNPCKYSPSGFFGSKFTTVIVTGDDKNQVHMEGYQVSNQCMALVRDKCLVPSKDAPELGYVKESSNEQYVPDVYYNLKDEYNNQVTKIARPLPVEYLLVDVPVSTPKSPQFTFRNSAGINPFPIENRPIAGHLQDFNALAAYLHQFDPDTPFLRKACDFHFLVFIATMDIVHIKDYIGPLLEAIKTQDEAKANDWARSEHWATVEQLIAASGGHGINEIPGNLPPNITNDQPAWTCAHCTFNNLGNSTACEMCQLPR